MDISDKAHKLGYRTRDGEYWHLDAAPTAESSYLRTKCGRRLGRWNLLAPKPIGHLVVDEVCVGCLRKVTK